MTIAATPFERAPLAPLETLRAETRQRIVSLPQLRLALESGLRLSTYIAYLTDVYHYARHSPTVIGRAAAGLARQRRDNLASYLLKHAGDELGHDDWAHADLTALGLTKAAIASSRPSSWCEAMIACEYRWADGPEPIALFGWMFTLEALGNDLARIMSEIAPAHLGAATSFLSGHADADAHHIGEILDALGRNACAEEIATVEQSAAVSADLYLAIIKHALDIAD